MVFGHEAHVARDASHAQPRGEIAYLIGASLARLTRGGGNEAHGPQHGRNVRVVFALKRREHGHHRELLAAKHRFPFRRHGVVQGHVARNRQLPAAHAQRLHLAHLVALGPKHHSSFQRF